MDEQAARAKYPDAPVDLSLRGHSSFRRTDWEPMPGDVFPCGKYMGQSIAECTDWSYLYWAVDTNMLCAERRDIAVSVLLKSGRYAEYDGTILPMDRVNELLAEDAARDEISAAIDLNGCVDLLNVTNIKAWDENEYGSETAVERVNLIWDRWRRKDNPKFAIRWKQTELSKNYAPRRRSIGNRNKRRGSNNRRTTPGRSNASGCGMRLAMANYT